MIDDPREHFNHLLSTEWILLHAPTNATTGLSRFDNRNANCVQLLVHVSPQSEVNILASADKFGGFDTKCRS